MADEEKLSKKEQKKLEKEEKKKKKAEGEAGVEEDDEEGAGGTALVIIVAVLIVVVWIAILSLLVKMDVGGFGSTVLYPILKDVPVVNNILPEVEDYAEEDAAYSFATVDDAVVRIKELEAEIQTLKAEDEDGNAQMADLEAQAAELQSYKEREAEFEKTKEKFYEEVVFSDQSPDINEYKKYYESIDSENAAAIYKQVVEQLQEQDNVDDYVKAYSSMKPKQAAAIFNTMTDNLNLVAKILKNMDAEARGDILGAMDTDTAARVTAILEP